MGNMTTCLVIVLSVGSLILIISKIIAELKKDTHECYLHPYDKEREPYSKNEIGYCKICEKEIIFGNRDNNEKKNLTIDGFCRVNNFFIENVKGEYKGMPIINLYINAIDSTDNIFEIPSAYTRTGVPARLKLEDRDFYWLEKNEHF